MPMINKRNADHIYIDGASAPVEAKLTEAEAVLVYGAEAVAGWYAFAETEESSVARESDEEMLKNENNVIVKRLQKKDEGVITARLLQTDTATMKLCDLLAESPHLYRVGYAVTGGIQLYGLRNAYMKGDFKIEGKAGEVRKRDVEIRGSRTADGQRALEYDTVSLDPQAVWPEDMADFAD